jgi:hypothetical protein
VPAKRQYSRVVYEFHLGKKVEGKQWQELKKQMQVAGMPLIPVNLGFVAKIKSLAPRFRVDRQTLADCIKLATVLGEKEMGVDIKREVFLLRPNLSEAKFWYWFRKAGFPFSEKREYEISYLSEVFYKLMGSRSK